MKVILWKCVLSVPQEFSTKHVFAVFLHDVSAETYFCSVPAEGKFRNACLQYCSSRILAHVMFAPMSYYDIDVMVIK